MPQAMSEIDLNALSLDELKALQKDVGKAIESYEKRQRQEALAVVEATAREMGFSLAELAGDVSKGRKRQLPAKYQHPENPSLTWSGRGRRPDWIKEAMAAGTPLEHFLIK